MKTCLLGADWENKTVSKRVFIFCSHFNTFPVFSSIWNNNFHYGQSKLHAHGNIKKTEQYSTYTHQKKIQRKYIFISDSIPLNIRVWAKFSLYLPPLTGRISQSSNISVAYLSHSITCFFKNVHWSWDLELDHKKHRKTSLKPELSEKPTIIEIRQLFVMLQQFENWRYYQ